MSTFNYNRIAKIAQQQIARFGQTVTITKRADGAYNTSTSSIVVTETTETGKGVVESYTARETDGTLIQANDLKLILSTQGITQPSNDDHVTLASGVKYVIKNVDMLSPAGTPVLYTCQLRK